MKKNIIIPKEINETKAREYSERILKWLEKKQEIAPDFKISLLFKKINERKIEIEYHQLGEQNFIFGKTALKIFFNNLEKKLKKELNEKIYLEDVRK